MYWAFLSHYDALCIEITLGMTPQHEHTRERKSRKLSRPSGKIHLCPLLKVLFVFCLLELAGREKRERRKQVRTLKSCTAVSRHVSTQAQKTKKGENDDPPKHKRFFVKNSHFTRALCQHAREARTATRRRASHWPAITCWSLKAKTKHQKSNKAAHPKRGDQKHHAWLGGV